MSARVRKAITIVTAIIATVLAIAVPLGQLRTPTTVTTCCCPDPSHCHCPVEAAHRDETPAMRRCHRSSHELVTADAPASETMAYVLVAPPTRVSAVATWMPGAPHPTPDPPRPSAPS